MNTQTITTYMLLTLTCILQTKAMENTFSASATKKNGFNANINGQQIDAQGAAKLYNNTYSASPVKPGITIVTIYPYEKKIIFSTEETNYVTIKKETYTLKNPDQSIYALSPDILKTFPDILTYDTCTRLKKQITDIYNLQAFQLLYVVFTDFSHKKVKIHKALTIEEKFETILKKIKEIPID